MAKPYTVPNNVSGVLASTYVHGTDNHLHLVAIGLFSTGGGFVRVYTTDKLHWADLEYTGVSTNDLTGLALCTGGNVESEAAYSFPAGSIVARVPVGQDISELIMGPASATAGQVFLADGTTGKKAKLVTASTTTTHALFATAGDPAFRALTAGDMPDAQTAASLTARSAAGLGLYEDGGDGIFVADGGIVTMAKQSGCGAYQSNIGQKIPTLTDVRLLLDTELFDTQGEFNSSVVSGTATATTASKLVDAGQFTEAAAYYVGRRLWNTTDNTYSYVTAKDDDNTLSIANDIIANTETYKLYSSIFTAQKAGLYVVVATISVTSVDTKTYSVGIVKNESMVAYSQTLAGAAGPVAVSASGVLQLAANDYVWANIYFNCATLSTLITAGIYHCTMQIAKVA